MNLGTSGLGTLGIGMAILYGGYVLIRRQMSFEATSTMTTGVVTEVLTMKRSESNSRTNSQTTYFAPVVEFRTADGKLMTHRSNDYVSPNQYAAGMELEIRYNPARPSESQVNNGFLNWLWPVALSIVGSIFFLIGAVITISPPE
jgi:hypothetical protein